MDICLSLIDKYEQIGESMKKPLNLLFWISSILGTILWAYQGFKDYNSCKTYNDPYSCEMVGVEAPVEIIGIALILISISSMLFLRNHSALLGEEE